MAGNLQNNSWSFSLRIGSCPDLLLRNFSWRPNTKEAGAVAFNAFYFGPASTGALVGSASIGATAAGRGGTTGTPGTGHLWNNSWLFSSPRLGSTPDVILRQMSWPPNTQEAGAKAFTTYYFGASGGAVTGTTAILFTESGALLGAGELDGATTITFTESGLLLGLGKLSGSSTILFTEVATLNLIGSAAIAFTESGSLSGAIAAAGSATITFTESGVILGLAEILGASNIAFTEAGAIGGLAGITGNTAILFTESGLLVGIIGISGNTAVIVTESGVLSGLLRTVVITTSPTPIPSPPIRVVIGETTVDTTEPLPEPTPPTPVLVGTAGGSTYGNGPVGDEIW